LAVREGSGTIERALACRGNPLKREILVRLKGLAKKISGFQRK